MMEVSFSGLVSFTCQFACNVWMSWQGKSRQGKAEKGKVGKCRARLGKARLSKSRQG